MKQSWLEWLTGKGEMSSRSYDFIEARPIFMRWWFWMGVITGVLVLVWYFWPGW
jgi:hypothetical protein